MPVKPQVNVTHGLRINSQMAASCEPVLLEEKKVVVIQYLLVSSKTLGEGGVQGQGQGKCLTDVHNRQSEMPLVGW